MEQTERPFALVVGKDDRVIEIRERFEGVDEGLRKGLVADGIDASPKHCQPRRAARLDILIPFRPSIHGENSLVMLSRISVYLFLYMPYMVYSLNWHSGMHIRKLNGSPLN